MAVRILASDLDGTLLNEKGKISSETAEAIKKAQNAGIKFLAVTGRAWGTAHPIFQEAGIEADYVLLNGAEFRTSAGEVIYQEAMDQEVAKKMINHLSDLGLDIEVNTDRGDFTTNTKVCQIASEILDFSWFWKQEPKILKIFAFSEESDLAAKSRKYLPDWKGISITCSAAWNIEITAEKAVKGRMLKTAMEFYHVSNEEVLIFGDGENDATMFREFVHSRAMENAVPTIRRMAEKVIESNRKNGVAKEINQILGGLEYGIF